MFIKYNNCLTAFNLLIFNYIQLFIRILNVLLIKINLIEN